MYTGDERKKWMLGKEVAKVIINSQSVRKHLVYIRPELMCPYKVQDLGKVTHTTQYFLIRILKLSWLKHTHIKMWIQVFFIFNFLLLLSPPSSFSSSPSFSPFSLPLSPSSHLHFWYGLAMYSTQASNSRSPHISLLSSRRMLPFELYISVSVSESQRRKRWRRYF